MKLDFDRFPYLEAIYSDTSTDITLMCGVQSGKTEWITVDAFALLSMGISYQLVQPKDDIRVLFARTRLDEPISRSPYYQEYIKSVGSLYKWLGDGFSGILRVVFSNREDEMIAFPADCIGVDEVDKCNIDNLALLRDRLLGSEFALSRRSSTPTTEGNDRSQVICWHYNNTDQRQYYVPCDSCGHEQRIDWFKSIVEEQRDVDSGRLEGYKLRDSSWNLDKERDILPICLSCGLPFNRLNRGRYYPSTHVPKTVWQRGYQFNKLLSPLVRLRDLWSDYEKSVSNPYQLQRFFNSILGMPYSGEGTKITENMIYRCVKPYVLQQEVDIHEGPCSMGVDVGPEFMDVRISSYPVKGRRLRRLEYANKVRDSKTLHELVTRFNVKVCTVDAEPETRLMLEFQRTARCSVYVCYSREKQGYTLKDLLLVKVQQSKRMTIDRTIMMDSVLESWVKMDHELPKNVSYLSDGDYIKEMVNPTRVIEVDDKGREKYVWTSGADHSFMADVYDFCSMVLGGFAGGQYTFALDKPRSLVVSASLMDDPISWANY